MDAEWSFPFVVVCRDASNAATPEGVSLGFWKCTPGWSSAQARTTDTEWHASSTFFAPLLSHTRHAPCTRTTFPSFKHSF
jgi:hypothetical protein